MSKVTNPKARLEYLRAELRAERISYYELAELQSLAQHIEPGDVELLEAAGVPEHAEPEPMDKATIMQLLHAWIRQRPGLDFHNYGDVSSYRSELRGITRDLNEARAMLLTISHHDSITAADLLYAVEHSFSGRLSIKRDAKGRAVVDYCTGQYWPTEYRRAVCAVAASALWAWYRDKCLPADTEHKGDAIQKWARREFGRGIAARWFR